MGCCVAECLIPDVLKHHSAFTFKVKQPKNSHTGKEGVLLGMGDEGSGWPEGDRPVGVVLKWPQCTGWLRTLRCRNKDTEIK